MKKTSGLNRRDFLKHAGLATGGLLGFPYFVRPSALGKEGSPAPSNRITVGAIGLGWMGTCDLQSFLNEPDVQVVAVCDVDKSHLEAAQKIVNDKYGNSDCRTYQDFRDLIARDDIDVVMMALPDHWHAIPAIEAARRGKDIFGEKPLTQNFREGQALCETVNRYGRIWQTNSWQRSVSDFRFAAELVLNGRIGKVHTVEVGLPSGPGPAPKEPFTAPPPELDYDRWLGPAPWAPYCPSRVHINWRWNLDYGGGYLMDWIGHHLDIAHWGLNLNTAFPTEVEGYGDYLQEGIWNCAPRFCVHARYAQGTEIVIAGGHGEIEGGTKWIGTDGWVWVDRLGLDAWPRELLKERFGPNDIHLYKSPGHVRNFLDCVKSRQKTLAPCEVSHCSATPGHLGQIAMKLGRKVRFDSQKMAIIGDETANSMLGRPMRSPWHL